MTIEIPPYNNMPIYNLYYSGYYKLAIVIVRNNGKYACAVYSAPKKQYVNDMKKYMIF